MSIKTPHAAVKIWNYIDRASTNGIDHEKANKVEGWIKKD